MKFEFLLSFSRARAHSCTNKPDEIFHEGAQCLFLTLWLGARRWDKAVAIECSKWNGRKAVHVKGRQKEVMVRGQSCSASCQTTGGNEGAGSTLHTCALPGTPSSPLLLSPPPPLTITNILLFTTCHWFLFPFCFCFFQLECGVSKIVIRLIKVKVKVKVKAALKLWISRK